MVFEDYFEGSRIGMNKNQGWDMNGMHGTKTTMMTTSIGATATNGFGAGMHRSTNSFNMPIAGRPSEDILTRTLNARTRRPTQEQFQSTAFKAAM